MGNICFSDEKPVRTTVVPKVAKGDIIEIDVSADKGPPKELAFELPAEPTTKSLSELLHLITKSTLGGALQPPLQTKLELGANVLSVGARSVFWAIEIAKTFPKTTVHVVDSSASAFDLVVAPSNVKFVVGSAVGKLPFEDKFFDLVYQSFVNDLITAVQWNGVVKELVRVTKTHGYVEVVELSQVENAGDKLGKISSAAIASQKAKGVDTNASSDLYIKLHDNGVEFIDYSLKSLPINFGGKVGEYTAQILRKILGADDAAIAESTESQNAKVKLSYAFGWVA